MLYFILSWNLLLLACLMIGMGVLNLCDMECLIRPGDRIFLGTWLGLIVLSMIFMVVSVMVPLSIGVGLGSIMILAFVSALSERTRQEFRLFKTRCTPKFLGSILLLEISLATLMSQPIEWIDSAIYHIGAIRWLNQFGVVPGIALINERFGYISSWFALSAPFVSEWWGEHMGAVTNGFIVLIAILSGVIFGKQLLSKQAVFTDLFGFFFFLGSVVAYGIDFSLGKQSLISFSPDIPVTFSLGLIAWLILMIGHQQQLELNIMTRSSKKNRLSLCDGRFLILVLSAGALSFKLTALPIVPIVILFYGLRKKQVRIRKILLGSVIFSLLLLPMMTMGVMASGCPLYPSRLMCFDLPWTLSLDSSLKALRPVLFLKGQDRILHLSDIQDWYWIVWHRAQWYVSNHKMQGLINVAVFLMTLAVFIVIFSRWKKSQNQGWVLVLGILGSLFILLTSPLIRFGLGYFTVIFALVLSRICARFLTDDDLRINSLIDNLIRRNILNTLSLFSIGLVLVLTYPQAQSHFFLPPKLPSEEMILTKNNDVSYVYPVDEQPSCWAAQLPCAIRFIEEDIALRHPQVGIRGGFIRVEKKQTMDDRP